MLGDKLDPMRETGRDVPCPSRRSVLAAALAGLGSAALSGCSLPGPLGDTLRAGEKIQPALATVFDSAPRVSRVTIMMVGDMLIHEGVWASGQKSDGTYNYDHFFTQLADEFSSADIAMVNQETVLGGVERGLEGFPYFNSPQELGDAEVKAGVDVALSATNHSLDHGFDGITWTLDYWRQTHPEMLVPGISDSEDDVQRVCMLERNGINVAILNYAEFSNSIYLPEGKPWCLNMLRNADLEADVSRAREAGADLVIACPHWGTEYVYTPDSGQLRWAGHLVEAGVDAIIGTHPHVLEPVEVWEGPEGKQVPIFWSLGNYVSWQIEKPRMLGGMAKLTAEKTSDGCRIASYSLTPLVTHKALNASMGVYRLSDYTDELASKNAIRQAAGCADFTVEYCHDLVAEILGSAYNRDACILEGTLA